jgi:hypothetical protein
MSIPILRPMDQHQQVGFYQSTILRTPSPFFAPPVPTGMQEPGTNWFTIVTAEGPHTTMTPGTRGGIANFKAQTAPYVPLTRKGG